jgi:hypothetical protein
MIEAAIDSIRCHSESRSYTLKSPVGKRIVPDVTVVNDRRVRVLQPRQIDQNEQSVA